MIVVVDLDGTLSDSAHRQHLAQAKLWDEFHSRLGEDECHKDVEKLLELINYHGHFVVGLTGRNEEFRNATQDWLDRHDIARHFDHLLMRPNGDWRSDAELKPALLEDFLEELGQGKSNVWFILEDRDKVVEAWRNEGYNCWQVRPGGY